MSGIPSKPAGPPPATPPGPRGPPIDAGGGSIKGVGEIKARPGPPPMGPPTSAMKPPPVAPPPRALMSTGTNRPAPENIQKIEIKAPVPVGGPETGSRPQSQGSAAPPGRGPAPRGAPPPTGQTEYAPDAKVTIKKDGAPAKQGAIAMFEGPIADPTPAPAKSQKSSSGDQEQQQQQQQQQQLLQQPAGTMPRGPPPRPGARPGPPPPRPMEAPPGRAPRPLAPAPQAPGIPEGQPLPPNQKPEDSVKAPAPSKPPPNRGRVPPKEGEKGEKIIVADPDPPGTEPPFPRGKREKVEEVVYQKRRDRNDPEFEEEEDEGLETDDFASRAVKQPNGLPRQEWKPPDPNAKTEEQLAVEAAEKAEEDQRRALEEKKKPVVQKVGGKSAFEKMKEEEAKKKAEKLAKEAKDAAGSDDENAEQQERPPEEEEEEDDEDPEAEKIAQLPPSKQRELAPKTFVPPPPSLYEEKIDESRLGAFLSAGRLSMRLIEGQQIRKKGDNSKAVRTDPYVKFKLGAAERHPWKLSTAKRKQNDFPQFDNEMIYFDVVDPKSFVMNDDLTLTIEIWNKSTFKDDNMGGVTMSVVRFLRQPYVTFEELLPLTYVGGKKSESKLKIEFVFEEARSGLFSFTLYEARGLRSLDAMGRQNPYVQFTLGDLYKKRSLTVENGGTAPYFAEEEVTMWVDSENWVNDLKIDIVDEDVGSQKPIGSTHFSLLPYMNTRPANAKQDSYDLFYYVLVDPRDDREKKEVAQGELVMKVTYYTAGKLLAMVDKARNIQYPETYTPPSGDLARIDPYVHMTIKGKASTLIKRSASDKDGGADPTWDQPLTFDIVDQHMLLVEVFHQNILGLADVLLGYAEVSLLQVFRNGHTSSWLALKQRKANGGVQEAGNIFLDLKFEGPTGVSFPQLRDDVDQFDDTVRKVFTQGMEPEPPSDVVVVPEAISTNPSDKPVKKKEVEEEEEEKKAIVMEAPPEFSDAEIVAAFKFIDLDHNNFVGAAEIRHILVCMGEMITDEEIDCMISMVDMDGDGQVSFAEFRALVLHPDPSGTDMHKVVNAIKDDEVAKERQGVAAGGKVAGSDLKAFQRTKELTARESKKKMLATFVYDNEVTFDYVRTSFDNYLALPKEKRIGNRVRFPEFAKALLVEPINEYRLLHTLFDNDDLGNIDFREFLLSLMNFVEVDKEARIRFSFTMFDDRKTGFITQKEIEEILRGNHMISLQSVQRKAETVMKQATANNSGSVTMNEFVVISKKFPNIILPGINGNEKGRNVT